VSVKPEKHHEIFEIFQLKFSIDYVKYFVKYFTTKNFMKFYITKHGEYTCTVSVSKKFDRYD